MENTIKNKLIHNNCLEIIKVKENKFKYYKLIKNILKFIFFDMFILSIFFINNYLVFFLIFLFNFIIQKILKINFKQSIGHLTYILPIIIFTFIINSLISNVKYAFLIMTRFIIACYSTYIFSKCISVIEIIEVIEKILSPLKLFRINTSSVGLLISIGISFIPIMKDEIVELKQILTSKGYIMKINNIHIFIRPLIISILKRTNEIEKAIIAKGYIE